MTERIASLSQKIHTRKGDIRVWIWREVPPLSVEELMPGQSKPCVQAQDIDLQKAAARVRTDLDRFSKDEIRVLVRHGYEVACHEYLQNDPTLKPPHGSVWEPWDPLPAGWPDHQSPIDAYDAAASRRRELALILAGPPGSWKSGLKAYVQQQYDAAREEAKRLRPLLEKSSRRRYIQFDADDPASWMIVAIAVVAAALIVLVVRAAYSLITALVMVAVVAAIVLLTAAFAWWKRTNE